MPAGRPSLYKPEYCEKVIELGKLGKSLTKMALACNVDKKTLHDWAEKHEEFALSLARARAESLAWWEDEAQNNVGNAKYNSSLWKMMVGSQHREEYGEMKRALEVSGPNGAPIEVKSTVVSAENLDEDAREALRYVLDAVENGYTETDDEPFVDDDEEEGEEE